jgi:hypothetical protein
MGAGRRSQGILQFFPFLNLVLASGLWFIGAPAQIFICILVNRVAFPRIVFKNPRVFLVLQEI